MKKIIALLFMMFLFASAASSEMRWQDQTLPLKHIKYTSTLYKVISNENNIIKVGSDIPSGLYGVSGFRFENSPDINVEYAFGIMRGAEIIFQSDKMNTDDNADLIIPLFDGDTLIIITPFDDVVYLYSVDHYALKSY